jgi:hypothetical protein
MRGGYVGLMNCVFAAQKAVCPFHPSCDCYITFLETACLSGLGHNRHKSPKSFYLPIILHLDARSTPTREC